jgi:phage tail-like protein
MTEQLPAGSANFHITFGSVDGSFTSCEGLSAKVGVVDNHASAPQGKHVFQRYAGPPEGGQITLKRPLTTGDKKLQEWAKKSRDDNKSAQVDGTVMVLTSEGQTVVTYAVADAWVSEYSTGNLDASSSKRLEETVIIVHTGIKVQ